MINIIIGFIFLILALIALVAGDTASATGAIAFYGSLILANIHFTANA